MLQPQEIQKNLKHNLAANLIDGSFFGFALGFASFTTIIPLFISNLTDSAILIGLIPAIHNVGWQLPQLLMARQLSRMEVFKPFVLKSTIHERAPFLGLVFITILLPIIGKPAALAIAFLLLIWQGLGAGFAANPWQNLIGKIIPSTMRATFFGMQSAGANLLAGVGAILAGFILEKLAFPYGFTACFLIACGLMVISWFFLRSTREPPHVLEPLSTDHLTFWGSVRQILKQDKPFLWFVISRMVFQFALMASAFYTVYAVKNLGMGEVSAGVMTSILFIIQVGSGVVFGWIADHLGKLPVLQIGVITAVIGAIGAWAAPNYSWFFGISVFAGIANSVFWAIGIAVTMEFGTEANRPTYVGLANTLIAPSAILAPILGGWLADDFGYKTTFLVSAIFGLLAFLVMGLFVKLPRRKIISGE